MATAISLPTLVQKRSLLYRGFTTIPSGVQYTPSYQIKVGTNSSAAQQTDTDLITAIPINDGTVCDSGAYTFTGSAGGANTTNNTTTYKPGANITDNTAQNLITTGSNVLKQWTKTTLSISAVPTKYVGQWLYVSGITAYNKLKTSGTAVEFRYGSDASNYYSFPLTASAISIGWNWITKNNNLMSALATSGSPATLSRYDILINTNNATDAFVVGDVVYDLLRQWTAADTLRTFDAGYPTIDLVKLQSQWTTTLFSTDAVGFNIDSTYVMNFDTTISANEAHTYASQSKGTTDEFVFTGRGNIL